MPAVSQKQRAFLYATKGAAWVALHHFNNEGPLPKYVNQTRSRKALKHVHSQTHPRRVRP
jgi:hypothetical protein